MSTQGGDVVFKFTGDTTQLVTAMNQVASKAADTGEKAASGFEKLSANTGKAVQVTGALGGVLGKLNPEVGVAITGVGALAGVMQGLRGAGVLTAAALGPLAAVIVAGAGAYAYLSHEADAAEAAMKRASDGATMAQTAHEGLEKIITEVGDRYRVATGKITAGGLSAEKQVRATNEAFDEEAKAIYAASGSDEQRLSKLTALERRRRSTLDLIKATADAESGSTGNAADADKARAEALKELNDAQAAEAAQAKTDESILTASMAAIAKASNDAALSQMDDMDKVQTAMLDQLATLKATAEAARAVTQEGTSARETMEREYRDAVTAVTAAADAKLAEMADAQQERSHAAYKADAKAFGDAQDEKTKKAKETQEAQMQATASIFGSLADIYYATADHQSKAGRKGAREAFAAAQAFAITQATINGALAITQAWGTVPTPAAPFAAVAAALAVGVQIAAIASQSPPKVRHYGGVLYPDEATVKVRSGEAVLTPQATAAMGGAAGVAAYNRDTASGMASGGSSGTMIRIGRYAFREGLRGDVRAGGVIAQEIDKRANQRGLRPGQSGRLASA